MDIFSRASSAVFRRVNRVREWHELPNTLAALNLRTYREEMRELNLYDTGAADGDGNGHAPAPVPTEDLPKHRTYDGSNTDAHDSEMGRAGARFGRNHPLGLTFTEGPHLILKPNPRR